MNKMKWKVISEFPNYSVSNTGMVKSNYRVVSGILKQGKILSPFPVRGYLRVTLQRGKKRRGVSIHRLVAEAFIPNSKRLPQINHINGVKSNNHHKNLEWCTPKQNTCHAVMMGLVKPQNKGQDSPVSKLSDSEVREIKKLLATGDTQKNISQRFGVSQACVSDIKIGRTWR